jgi:hypothetical protein
MTPAQLKHMERLLRTLHSGSDADSVGLQLSALGEYGEILDLLRQRRLRLVSLGEPSVEDAATLQSCGIAEDFLDVFRGQTNRDPPGCQDNVVLTHAEQTILRSVDVRAWPYSYHFPARGGVYAADPFTLQAVRSTASIVLDGVAIVQRHVGREVFYTVTAGWRGKIVGMYVPSRSLVVVADDSEGTPNFRGAVTDLFHRLDALLARAEFTFGSSSTSRLGLVIGFVNNLGHYFWQEMTAIESYVLRGLHSRIEALVLGPHCFIDPVKLFPELNGVRVFRADNADCLFPLANGFADIYIRPIGAIISPALRRRIATTSLAATSIRTQEQISTAAETHFLVYVNLRAHNKVWVNQVSGLATFLSRLEGRVSRPLGVVLDGWWDTRAIASQLIAALPSTIDVYDTVGVNLHVSISWANSVDFFISVIGSGLVLSSWFTGKPGIAHGNSCHQYQETFWNAVNEGALPTSFARSAGGCDDGSLYSNYDLDTQTLFDEADKLLRLYHSDKLVQ